MAFDDDDQSVQDSAPVTLFEFTATGHAPYRYTSLDVDFTFGGNVYTSVPVMHAAISSSSTGEAQELVVTLPASTAVVYDNAFNASVPSILTVMVTVVQQVSDESKVVWSGNVDNITISRRMAKLRSPSLLDGALAKEAPSIKFQQQCNHRLYDANCSLNPAGFSFTTTASVVSGTTISVASIFGNEDGYFRNGEMLHVASGERRLIYSQVGTTIAVSSPFRNLVATDSVTIFAGCDKFPLTCAEKFFNIENFGGHPFIDDAVVVLVNNTIRAVRTGR